MYTTSFWAHCSVSSEKISSNAILLTFKREFRASFFLEVLEIFLLVEKEKEI